ncbi:MAG: helix-turn-helix domain-containing protein [Pseudomonadales bacterium]
MSFKLVAQVMDLKVGSPLRKIILIKLADQASDEGLCWPSYDTIAKTCEISKRSVITHIQKLEEQGFLRIEKRYNKDAGKNFSNRYHLTLSRGGANAALVQMSVKGGARDSLGGANAAPEPTNEPTNEPINKDTTQNKKVDKKEVKFQPVKPEQVSDQVWNDLLAVRKTKRAVESQTAWTRINNSIDKAQKATGHTLEDIYSYWVKRSWAGFEHQWYIDAHPQPTNNIQGATNANTQPSNRQHQQFDTNTTAGYAAKLDADADAYYAEQAAIAQQAAYGSTENAF